MQKNNYIAVSWRTVLFTIMLCLFVAVMPAVAAPPAADFSALPTSGPAPLGVQFTDLSSNIPTSWEWSFGDNPGYVYTTNILHPPTGIDVVYPNGTVAVLFSWTGVSYGLALDPDGNIYSSDYNGNVVRKYRTDGGIEVIGSGFTYPAGIARDDYGNIYVADSGSFSVFKITPGGGRSTVRNDFTSPAGVAVSRRGNLYVSDLTGVYRITPGGAKSAVGSGYSSPMGVAVDCDENVYVADFSSVIKITPGGTMTTLASGGQPMGIAVDDFTGNVYYGDVETGIIYMIIPGGTRRYVGSTNSLGGAVALRPESFAQMPLHTYTTPGWYTVSLIAANSDGSDSEVQTGFISVTALQPPVAAFTNATPRNGIVPLTVTFTDQSTNTPASWLWNFGDGDSTNATVQNPVHTYASAGTYNVNLTATNAAGTNSTVKSGFITVNAWPQVTISDVTLNADGTGTATIVLDRAPTGLTGFKLDLAITNQLVSDNLTFVTYPSGFSVYDTRGSSWPGAVYTNNVNTLAQGGFSSGYIRALDSSGSSFPDGSTDILLATVTLHGLTAGSTTLNGTLLSLTDRTGGNLVPTTTVKNGTINVTLVPAEIPVVNFFGDNRTGPAPLTVNFTDQSTNNPTAWAWDFQNDGMIDATTQNATFTYLTPGIYQVNLTASNSAGSAFRLNGNYINVTGLDPRLPGTDFTSDTRTGPAPMMVHFTDLTTGNPTAWAWDFQNDGVIDSTVQNATWTFTTPGIYQVNFTATNAYGNKSLLKANYINVTSAPVVNGAKIGVFRNSTHRFYLDSNGNGVWNGASIDKLHNFGQSGDLPISGDWNNDAITEIGVFRNSTHKFYLDYDGNGIWNGAVDRQYVFGVAGDIPVTGDWNNNSITETGVFRPSTRTFYLDYDGNGLWNGAADRKSTFGVAGDIPITGDWNDNGISEIGVFHPPTQTFFLDYDGNGMWNGATDLQYTFGVAGDIPITGDWNSNGVSKIGVFHPPIQTFFLDYTGDGVWNGATDRQYTFGGTGDVPVIGVWS